MEDNLGIMPEGERLNIIFSEISMRIQHLITAKFFIKFVAALFRDNRKRKNSLLVFSFLYIYLTFNPEN